MKRCVVPHVFDPKFESSKVPKQRYTTYRQHRLVNKDVKLFDRMKKPRVQKKTKEKSKIDLGKKSWF